MDPVDHEMVRYSSPSKIRDVDKFLSVPSGDFAAVNATAASITPRFHIIFNKLFDNKAGKM